MALCSLLNLPTDDREAHGFVFDHDQEHRREMLVGSGRSSLAALQPNIIDPAPIDNTSRRAGNWHQDHQRAHDDFYLAQAKVPSNQNMIDSNLAEPASLAWWTFVNHMQHYIAQQTI